MQWKLLLRPDVLYKLASATLFGPVICTVLNLLLVGPVIEEAPDTSQELRAHAAGSLAAAVGGGYSNYVAVSNTAIHIKCGGRTKGSCYSSSKTSVADRATGATRSARATDSRPYACV